MKRYYFVGGPKPDHVDEFFQRLQQLGGSPNGWQVFPHASGDGKALHLITAKTEKEILEHLQHFNDIYEHTDIIEISEGKV